MNWNYFQLSLGKYSR